MYVNCINCAGGGSFHARKLPLNVICISLFYCNYYLEKKGTYSGKLHFLRSTVSTMNRLLADWIVDCTTIFFTAVSPGTYNINILMCVEINTNLNIQDAIHKF